MYFQIYIVCLSKLHGSLVKRIASAVRWSSDSQNFNICPEPEPLAEPEPWVEREPWVEPIKLWAEP